MRIVLAGNLLLRRKDRLDGAEVGAGLDEVALAQWLIDRDRHRAEQVLHGLLRREGQREAADAEAGD